MKLSISFEILKWKLSRSIWSEQSEKKKGRTLIRWDYRCHQAGDIATGGSLSTRSLHLPQQWIHSSSQWILAFLLHIPVFSEPQHTHTHRCHAARRPFTTQFTHNIEATIKYDAPFSSTFSTLYNHLIIFSGSFSCQCHNFVGYLVSSASSNE